MQKHFASQRKSGLTIEAYCDREAISHSTWWYWHTRLNKSRQQSVSPSTFIQLQQPAAQLEAAGCEITLPNGVQLCVPPRFDAALMRHIVRCVSRVRRGG
jgi:hypothetical protein